MWIDDGQWSERFWLKQEKQQYTIQVSTESITVSTQVQIQYFPCPEILQTYHSLTSEQNGYLNAHRSCRKETK